MKSAIEARLIYSKGEESRCGHLTLLFHGRVTVSFIIEAAVWRVWLWLSSCPTKTAWVAVAAPIQSTTIWTAFKSTHKFKKTPSEPLQQDPPAIPILHIVILEHRVSTESATYSISKPLLFAPAILDVRNIIRCLTSHCDIQDGYRRRS